MSAKTTQIKKKSADELLLEKKIEKCRKRISLDEQEIAAMNACQNAMRENDIIGVAVKHKMFGAGTIVKQDPLMITVKFALDSKRFVMPDALIDGFLVTTDDAVNEKISEYQQTGKQIKMAKEDISAACRFIRALENKKIMKMI